MNKHRTLRDSWNMDEQRVAVQLTGLRLYRRKKRCMKLTTRNTTFHTITSMLHRYRVAHAMKRPHPVGGEDARQDSTSTLTVQYFSLVENSFINHCVMCSQVQEEVWFIASHLLYSRLCIKLKYG